MGLLSKLFGLKPKKDIGEMLSRGGIVVDVRSPQEFKSGHLEGSINMPLDSFASNSNKLDPKKPIVVCCASGMRSSSALSILKSKGFEDAANGGGWKSLVKYRN